MPLTKNQESKQGDRPASATTFGTAPTGTCRAGEVADAPLWSENHTLAASREGWGLFDSTGSANGNWQVQRLDDPEVESAGIGFAVPALQSDEQAWRLVYEGTEQHHRAARAFLIAHNPKEWASIKKVGDALYPRRGPAAGASPS